jgi:hypothetical protein
MQIAPLGAIRIEEQDDGKLTGFTVDGLDGSPHDQRHQRQQNARKTAITSIASIAAGVITNIGAAPGVPARRHA